MISQTSRIDPSATVHPNVNIGDRTLIWQYCVILEGSQIGKDCNINAHCLVEGGSEIGDNVTIKPGVYVWDGVILEDNVFCGPNATFTNDIRPQSKLRPHHFLKTRVLAGASIGAGAVILPGLTIGENALVGAGAVVTKDVPAGETWVGNPARRVRTD